MLARLRAIPDGEDEGQEKDLESRCEVFGITTGITDRGIFASLFDRGTYDTAAPSSPASPLGLSRKMKKTHNIWAFFLDATQYVG
jgi:hypothetical protein